ncbi:hypothetical protein RHMOL_Rhmol02G0026200 [Rhododendron molle]|uniref:Uncharacterized protein n=1 Tax=Rhododendron molle TaxID=49168 RepID=A0ACC0PKY7_RHOML|nr:hypothetical protein RHMOL_Rhmol02G0026200 [Rhododendron molle]
MMGDLNTRYVHMVASGYSKVSDEADCVFLVRENGESTSHRRSKCLLSKPFSVLDVKMALDQVAGWKSPGPDGIPTAFYQPEWSWWWEVLTSSVLYFPTDLIYA